MPDENPNQPASPTYEELIESLEDIVERIESGEIGLEEAIDAYEEGAKLIARSRAVLARAEQRLEHLNLDDLKKAAEAELDG